MKNHVKRELFASYPARRGRVRQNGCAGGGRLRRFVLSSSPGQDETSLGGMSGLEMPFSGKLQTKTKPIPMKWQPQKPNTKPIFILPKIPILNQILTRPYWRYRSNTKKIPRNLGHKYQIPIWYWYFLGIPNSWLPIDITSLDGWKNVTKLKYKKRSFTRETPKFSFLSTLNLVKANGDIMGAEKISNFASAVNKVELPPRQKQIPRITDKVSNRTLYADLTLGKRFRSDDWRVKVEKPFFSKTRRRYQGCLEAVVEATDVSIGPRKDDKLASMCVVYFQFDIIQCMLVLSANEHKIDHSGQNFCRTLCIPTATTGIVETDLSHYIHMCNIISRKCAIYDCTSENRAAFCSAITTVS